MENTYLRPFIRPIISEGVVSYNKDNRACNIIRLKIILRESIGNVNFEKDRKIFYRIELYPDYSWLIKRIIELKDSNEVIPMLFFLFK